MADEPPKLDYGREPRRSRAKSALRAYAELLGMLIAISLLAYLLARIFTPI